MAHKLADELLKEILSPPLLVPDELFADTGAVSPFSSVDKSASDVLLVCKRWMRVATPSLYETVIIRSTAQAQALARALQNPEDFGRFIRKIRFEGAYADAIWKIVSKAPNITDFCFTLTVWSDVSVRGLTRSLENINPARVILTLAPVKAIKNAKVTELVNKLCYSIPKWTNLRTFCFSSSSTTTRRWQRTSEDEVHPDIVTALAASATLECVSLWPIHLGGQAPESLLALGKSASLKLIKVYHDSLSLDALTRLRDALDNGLRSRTEFIPRTTTSTFQSPFAPARLAVADAALPNPFFRPMSTASEMIRTDIWTRILEYAISNPMQYGYTLLSRFVWYDLDRFEYGTTSSLLRVCRSFRTAVLPFLLRHLNVEVVPAARAILRYFAENPQFALNVKTLRESVGEPAVPILLATSNLRRCAVTAHPAVLDALGRTAGTSLLELELHRGAHSSFVPSSLDRFGSLTRLSWTAPIESTQIGGKNAATPKALSNVTFLNLRLQSSEAVFRLLAQLTLPQLVEVQLGESLVGTQDFLAVHGAKVQTMKLSLVEAAILAACPNLQTLEIGESYRLNIEPASSFAFEAGHPTLRILNINWALSLHRRDVREQRFWPRFFEQFTRARYPKLEEIHLTSRNEIWPCSEREIKKSLWVTHAELLRSEGIALFDHTGRAWRPRLQVSK